MHVSFGPYGITRLRCSRDGTGMLQSPQKCNESGPHQPHERTKYLLDTSLPPP